MRDKGVRNGRLKGKERNIVKVQGTKESVPGRRSLVENDTSLLSAFLV